MSDTNEKMNKNKLNESQLENISSGANDHCFPKTTINNPSPENSTNTQPNAEDDTINNTLFPVGKPTYNHW